MKDRYYIVFILAVIVFTSCSPTHKVPAGDALYTGAKIKLDGPELSSKKKKALRQDMQALTRPKPNKKLLGIRFNLFFYNVGIMKNKWGEPPVLLSDVNLDYNEKVLQSALENGGFFHAKVEGDTTVKRKKASATYIIQTGKQYFISEVHFPEDTVTVLERTIIEASDKTFLKAGKAFDLELIKAERQRIDAYLKEKGFYYFIPDYLIIEADSTIGNFKVNLYVKVKTEAPPQVRKPYRINDIFIFTNYRLQSAATDTIKSDAEYYKGYYLVDKRHLYKPSMFDRAMQFEPGDIYNRTDHNRTLSRLINMSLFKFVKNRFEMVKNIDSAKLDIYYYLTPSPKKSIQAEINGNTKSNNLVGSSVTVGWRNRNTFRGGELLSIKASGGFEIQYSGNFKGYNTYRVGLETSLSFPRFLIPFFSVNSTGAFMPKTTILLGYDILNKQKLYTMQSFRSEFGYVWKENLQKEHTLNPVSITYVQPLYVSEEYKNSALDDPTLYKAIEKQFILGSTYNFNYNQLQGRSAFSSGFYFNGNVDLSGNIAGLVTGANAKTGDSVMILNAKFSQYARFEPEARIHLQVSPTSVWANRIIIGVGLPYGNSLSLPYIKQFFIGGTSSVRAFRSRSVGPGTYKDTTVSTFLPDQSGDLKLELNTELRGKLFSIIHGAVFVDAGNIWLFNSDSNKAGAKFSKDFIKELAVGGGVGLRLDVSFLVVRLDVAIPFRKPYLPDGQRWVFNQIDFSSREWRRENIIFNLGIGYPF